MRRRAILLSFLVLLCAARVSFAEAPGVSTSVDTGSGRSESLDTSKTNTKSHSTSDGTGGQNGNDSAHGTSTSEGQDLRSSNGRSHETGYSLSSPLVPYFVSALNKQYPWLRTLSIDDLLLNPIGQRLTYAQNLSALAQRNASADRYIRRDDVLMVMETLQKLGLWTQAQIVGASKEGQKLSSVLGGSYMSGPEWALVIRKTAKDHAAEIAGIQPTEDISGTCSFVGAYTSIQCGDCTLDVSRKSGFPELTCMGVPMFTARAANGMEMTANTSYRATDSTDKSSTKHSEKFARAQSTMNNYVRWAIDNSDATAAAKARKIVLDKTSKSSSKVDVVVKAAEKKSPPGLLLGMLGIR